MGTLLLEDQVSLVQLKEGVGGVGVGGGPVIQRVSDPEKY